MYRENPGRSDTELTTEPYTVFVASDEDREPTSVPELAIVTERGETLQQDALSDAP